MKLYKNTGLKSCLIEEFVNYAKKHNVNKLILFGSRARGDFREKSDIDLAFCGGNSSGFKIDIMEEARTLLFIDVVNMEEEIGNDLKDSINREGILLYEKI